MTCHTCPLPSKMPTVPRQLLVAVGSRNPVKVQAVQRAFGQAFANAQIDVEGYDVPSNVPDQPWGEQETRAGALQRAIGAHAAFCAARGAPPDYAVGLEGGAIEERLGDAHPTVPGLGSVVSCFAFMAILSAPSLSGAAGALGAAAGSPAPRWGIARTATFALPPRVVALMRGVDGSAPMELGDAQDKVFSEVNSKQKGGAVAKATNGLIDRTAYYEHALCCALAPLMHDDTQLYS